MSTVAIIGASPSGHNIALRLRDKDSNCQIILVSEEDYPAYDHFRLADFISGTISENDIFLCSESFYHEKNINFIKSKKVASLNTQKRTIYFKDKGSVGYDFLVIASGRSPVIPEIPGARKEGSYRLYTLADAKEFLKRYISQTVCISGNDNFALRIAESVANKFGVEVKLISRNAFHPSLIPGNVEVIHDRIEEIIGEGEVQAVKLSSGKAIGVSAVLFMDNHKSNIDFLKNTDVQVKDDFVVIDGFMRTNVNNIFACGSLVRKDSIVISMMLVDNIVRQMKGETCQIS
jgi:NAD(P)H-nitrite reductase large subunit